MVAYSSSRPGFKVISANFDRTSHHDVILSHRMNQLFLAAAGVVDLYYRPWITLEIDFGPGSSRLRSPARVLHVSATIVVISVVIVTAAGHYFSFAVKTGSATDNNG